MPKRLVLPLVVVMFACLSLPGSAQARPSIFVTLYPQATDLCTPDAASLAFGFQFTAKVKRKKVDAPKTIRLAFQTVDIDAGNQLLDSGSVTLRRSRGYKATAGHVVAPVGHHLAYYFKLRVPTKRQTFRFNLSADEQVPTMQELQAAGVPSCASSADASSSL